MRELGLAAEIRFAAYNQVFQELLDPAGLLASNAGGVNVVLVRFDDWPGGQAAEFVDAVRSAAGRMAVPLIVGPATMTTSLLLVNTYSRTYNDQFGAPYGQMIVAGMVCAALLINIALLLLAMWHSGRLAELVGRNTMAVVNKIVMILLAAIAVSLVRQGVVSIIHNPSGG